MTIPLLGGSNLQFEIHFLIKHSLCLLLHPPPHASYEVKNLSWTLCGISGNLHLRTNFLSLHVVQLLRMR